jgi:hypothetical protein
MTRLQIVAIIVAALFMVGAAVSILMGAGTDVTQGLLIAELFALSIYHGERIGRVERRPAPPVITIQGGRIINDTDWDAQRIINDTDWDAQRGGAL